MTDEWQGWLHEFPSREAVEAHVAASPPPPYASAWATGAPWMRVGGCGDLVVIYLAVIDGEVRERFGGDAAWHAMEMGRAGMWRPITALGEETGVRAAGPIIEALDAAAVRLARERDDATGSAARLRDELREAKAIINGRATAPTDAEIAAHAHPLRSPIGAWLVTANDGCRQLVHLWRPFDGDSRSEDWEMLRRRMGPFKFTIARWVPIDAEGCPCAWPVVEGER